MTHFINLSYSVYEDDEITQDDNLLVNIDDIATIKQKYCRPYLEETRGFLMIGCIITLKSQSNKIDVLEDLLDIMDLIKQAQQSTPYRTK